MPLEFGSDKTAFWKAMRDIGISKALLDLIIDLHNWTMQLE